jgi:hypothetical protein
LVVVLKITILYPGIRIVEEVTAQQQCLNIIIFIPELETISAIQMNRFICDLLQLRTIYSRLPIINFKRRSIQIQVILSE